MGLDVFVPTVVTETQMDTKPARKWVVGYSHCETK
jgi:hypothetical protein